MQIQNFVRTVTMAAPLLIPFYALGESAFEKDGHHREPKAHVHGQADLRINLQGNNFSVELTISAMDALGFEHHPKTDTEKKKMEAVEDLLRTPASWLSLADDALCTLQSSTLIQPYKAQAPHEGRMDDHDHSHKQNHNDHPANESSHVDFIINGEWQCTRAKELTEIRLEIFKHLPHLEIVKVKWINNGGAGVFSLTAEANRLPLTENNAD